MTFLARFLQRRVCPTIGLSDVRVLFPADPEHGALAYDCWVWLQALLALDLAEAYLPSGWSLRPQREPLPWNIWLEGQYLGRAGGERWSLDEFCNAWAADALPRIPDLDGENGGGEGA